jgi:hypothetical protein
LDLLKSSKEAQVLQFGTGLLRNACKSEVAKKEALKHEAIQISFKIIKSSMEIPALLLNSVALIGLLASLDEANQLIASIGGCGVMIDLLKHFSKVTGQESLLSLILQTMQYMSQSDQNATTLNQLGKVTIESLCKHPAPQVAKLAGNLLRMIDNEETDETKVEETSNDQISIFSKMLKADEDKQYEALCKIFDLAGKKENRAMFRKILPEIMEGLNSEFAENLEVAAGAISQLALDDVNNAELGARNCVPLLARLLKSGDVNVTKNALYGLANLACRNPNNRDDIHKEPILLLLVSLLKGKVPDYIPIILEILVSLALEVEIRSSFMKYGFIDALLPFLKDPKLRARTAAVLWNLSNDDPIHDYLYSKGAFEDMTELLPATDLSSKVAEVDEKADEAMEIIEKIRQQRQHQDVDLTEKNLKNLAKKKTVDEMELVTFNQVLEAEEDEVLMAEEEYVAEELEAEELVPEEEEAIELQPEESVEELQAQDDQLAQQDFFDELENANTEVNDVIQPTLFETSRDRRMRAESRMMKIQENKKNRDHKNDPVVDQEKEEKKRKATEKRKFIVDELLQTEKSYVDSLSKVRGLYMEPLQQNKILTDEQYKTIFGDINMIYKINSAFLGKLLKVAENKDNLYKSCQRLIGELFLESSSTFALYQNYINNFDNQDQAVVKLQAGNKKFAVFLGEAALKLEEAKFRQKDLASLLITPIQRLPRYKMLLEDLFRNSEAGDTGYTILEAAIEQIQKTTLMCNEKKREIEKVVEVEKLAEELKMPDLIQTGRSMEKVYREKIHFSTYEKGKPFTKTKKQKGSFYVMSDLCILGKAGKMSLKTATLFNLYRTKPPAEKARDIDRDQLCLLLENTKKNEICEIEFANKKERNDMMKLISALIQKIESDKVVKRMSMRQ